MINSQNIIQATDEQTDAVRLLVDEVAVTGMAIGNTRDNLALLHNGSEGCHPASEDERRVIL